MAIKNAEIISDANVFVDGVGHLGTTEEVKLPEIKQKYETIAIGGFERDIQTGIFEKMEAEITLREFSSVIYQIMAKNIQKGKAVTFIVKANLTQGGKRKSLVATISGNVNTNDNSLKAKEVTKRTIHISVRKYILEINGEKQVSMDTDNMIAEINGIDLLEEVRKNLM